MPKIRRSDTVLQTPFKWVLYTVTCNGSANSLTFGNEKMAHDAWERVCSDENISKATLTMRIDITLLHHSKEIDA